MLISILAVLIQCYDIRKDLIIYDYLICLLKKDKDRLSTLIWKKVLV